MIIKFIIYVAVGSSFVAARIVCGDLVFIHLLCGVVLCVISNLAIKIISEYDHRKEEPHNNHETTGRQTKQNLR